MKIFIDRFVGGRIEFMLTGSSRLSERGHHVPVSRDRHAVHLSQLRSRPGAPAYMIIISDRLFVETPLRGVIIKGE